MSGFFDKITKAAQEVAATAQEKASEGQIQLDIHALTGKLDKQAENLGYLAFRQHKGETITDEEIAKVLAEMTRIETERRAKQSALQVRERSEAPGVVEASAVASETPPGAKCACGAAVAVGAKFCPECGARHPDPV